MNKRFLIVLLGMLLTPVFAFAKHHPREIRATEMATSGFAAAGLAGAAGYLILRRRKLGKRQF